MQQTHNTTHNIIIHHHVLASLASLRLAGASLGLARLRYLVSGLSPVSLLWVSCGSLVGFEDAILGIDETYKSAQKVPKTGQNLGQKLDNIGCWPRKGLL